LAYEDGVTMDFSRLGRPMDNAKIESFNGTFRDRCLNVNWFLSMENAREEIVQKLLFWLDQFSGEAPIL